MTVEKFQKNVIDTFYEAMSGVDILKWSRRITRETRGWGADPMQQLHERLVSAKDRPEYYDENGWSHRFSDHWEPPRRRRKRTEWAKIDALLNGLDTAISFNNPAAISLYCRQLINATKD